LKLAREASQLRAAIRDNGRGFDPLAPRGRKSKPPGMGLVDMRERAALLGGHCRLHSAPGEGTEILVEMPLKSVDNSKIKPGEKGQTQKN
jgi:two-component system sensor histidine kinase UhpB